VDGIAQCTLSSIWPRSSSLSRAAQRASALPSMPVALALKWVLPSRAGFWFVRPLRPSTPGHHSLFGQKWRLGAGRIGWKQRDLGFENVRTSKGGSLLCQRVHHPLLLVGVHTAVQGAQAQRRRHPCGAPGGSHATRRPRTGCRIAAARRRSAGKARGHAVHRVPQLPHPQLNGHHPTLHTNLADMHVSFFVRVHGDTT
jgi:hypothetical protein